MKQLRIKDNQRKAKEDFFEVQMVVNRIADRTLEQLEQEGVFVFPEGIKETDDLTKDQMLLQSYNDEYVSATTIAKSLSLGEVQVRKDLNSISGAGRPKSDMQSRI